MSLENALEWIEEDEAVEVTPISIRVRKESSIQLLENEPLRKEKLIKS